MRDSISKMVLLFVVLTGSLSSAAGQIQRAELIVQEGHSDAILQVALSPDSNLLASCSADQTIKLWDIGENRELRTLTGHTASVLAVAFSPDGTTLASGSLDRTLRLWDLRTGRQIRVFQGQSDRVTVVAFSPDGKTLASGSLDGTVRLWQLNTGRELRTFTGINRASFIEFSPKGTLAIAGLDKTIHLFNVETGTALRSLTDRDVVKHIAFSPDGRVLATHGKEGITVWNVVTGREIWRTTEGTTTFCLSFSPDGKTLASCADEIGVELWDVATGNKIKEFGWDDWRAMSIGFSFNREFLFSRGADEMIRVWDLATAQVRTFPAKTVRSIQSDVDWLVVTPEGRFDGSSSAWNKILWRYGPNTFDVLPVEAFFNEYYSPGLLSEVATGTKLGGLVNIANLDRRQPMLKLSITPAGTRNVGIMVEVAEAAPDKNHQSGSGARDVRLFRNGSMIRSWRGDLSLKNGEGILNATVPLLAGQNTFTAHAYNRDNIRSREASITYIGSDSLKRAGTTHIVAIGIDKYTSPYHDLMFAVSDATNFAQEVQRQQQKINANGTVTTRLLVNEAATKVGILQTLQEVAKEAQPEDSVILFFSGHSASKDDKFYLIPYDSSQKDRRTASQPDGLQNNFDWSVSNLELTESLQSIDCRHLALIVDSGNSGLLLQTKSMAQFAYDKQMFVLLASQANQLSFESPKLKYGLLTYVLVEEGLRNGQAAASDGNITLQGWLNYAARRAPVLSAEVIGEQRAQIPRLFIRRESEERPFIVAKIDVKKIDVTR